VRVAAPAALTICCTHACTHLCLLVVHPDTVSGPCDFQSPSSSLTRRQGGLTSIRSPACVTACDAQAQIAPQAARRRAPGRAPPLPAGLAGGVLLGATPGQPASSRELQAPKSDSMEATDIVKPGRDQASAPAAKPAAAPSARSAFPRYNAQTWYLTSAVCWAFVYMLYGSPATWKVRRPSPWGSCRTSYARWPLRALRKAPLLPPLRVGSSIDGPPSPRCLPAGWAGGGLGGTWARGPIL